MPSRYDLHTHSLHSDGTLPPAALVARACAGRRSAGAYRPRRHRRSRRGAHRGALARADADRRRRGVRYLAEPDGAYRRPEYRSRARRLAARPGRVARNSATGARRKLTGGWRSSGFLRHPSTARQAMRTARFCRARTSRASVIERDHARDMKQEVECLAPLDARQAGIRAPVRVAPLADAVMLDTRAPADRRGSRTRRAISSPPASSRACSASSTMWR